MTLLEALRSARLVAIVRGSGVDAALRSVQTLVAEGVNLIEVSLTSADATTVIARAREDLGPDAWLGAGTVVTIDDVARAAEAGASFVVTPALGPSVAESRRRGLPVIAGAFTPSEVVSALERGADAVKLFPASLGGPGYFRALREPFPQVPFVPVGGVDEDAARAYLAAGAVAVGVGSPLVGDAASGGSLDELRRRARAFRHAVEGVGP
jgi:2-dehydro-3-deoxyphosphogluconate aldolase / (4S)-4-hydroxy-2-oxoglutarate aldolase